MTLTPEVLDPFDWRPNEPIPEDAYAAPAADGNYDCRSAVQLRHEAEAASRDHRPDAPALWKAYREKRAEMEQRRDDLRVVNSAKAAELGARIGKIRGVVVGSAEVDDFGGIELQITVDGHPFWTRPVKDPVKGYKTLRDAISARRREERRARNWLSGQAVWRRRVEWDGYEQVQFGVNEYGARWWPGW